MYMHSGTMRYDSIARHNISRDQNKMLNDKVNMSINQDTIANNLNRHTISSVTLATIVKRKWHTILLQDK